MNSKPHHSSAAQGTLFESAFVVLITGVFLALTGYRLKSPGFVLDNLGSEYTGALWAGQLMSTGYFPWGGLLTGYPFYHGTLTSYLMMPAFCLFGPSFSLVKVWPVVLGALTLVVTYFLVRSAFGRRVALLTLALLSVHPSFVGGIRIGNHPVTYLAFFSVSSLFLLLRSVRKRSLGNFAAGMFLAGLGMGTRLWYVWYVFGLIGTLILFRKDFSLAGEALRFRIKWVIIGTLSFLLGILPILRWEILSEFSSISHVIGFYLGADHRASPLISNFVNTIRGFSDVLSSRWVFSLQFDGHGVLENRLYPLAVLGSLIIFGFLLLRRDKSSRNREQLIVYSLSLLMVVASAFAPAGRPVVKNPIYFFVFYPFPQVFLSAVIVRCWDALKGSRWAILMLGFLSSVMIWEAGVLGLYMNYVRVFGGLGAFTDAMRGLAESAVFKESDIVLAGRRTSVFPNLYFWNPSLRFHRFQSLAAAEKAYIDHPDLLPAWQQEIRRSGYREIPSHAQLRPLAACFENPEENFFPLWEEEMRSFDSMTVLLIRYIYDPSPDFDLVAYWAVQKNQSLRLKARFHDRDGAPMIEAWVLEPAGRGGSGRFDPKGMAF